MDAVGVSESTATRALRPLKANRHTACRQRRAADESTPPPRPHRRNRIDRAGVEHDSRTGRRTPLTARHRAARCAPARRPRTRGGPRRSARSPIPALGTQYGSPVESATSAAPSADRADPSHPSRAAAVDTYASTRPTPGTATQTGRRPPASGRPAHGERPSPSRPPQRRRADGTTLPTAGASADVSIAHARAAVAVLAAHRAVQAQRRQAEHDHAERAARWHADDRHARRCPLRCRRDVPAMTAPTNPAGPAGPGGGLPGRDVGGRAGPRPGSAAPRRDRPGRSGAAGRASWGSWSPAWPRPPPRRDDRARR